MNKIYKYFEYLTLFITDLKIKIILAYIRIHLFLNENEMYAYVFFRSFLCVRKYTFFEVLGPFDAGFQHLKNNNNNLFVLFFIYSFIYLLKYWKKIIL